VVALGKRLKSLVGLDVVEASLRSEIEALTQRVAKLGDDLSRHIDANNADVESLRKADGAIKNTMAEYFKMVAALTEQVERLEQGVKQLVEWSAEVKKVLSSPQWVEFFEALRESGE